MIDYLKIDPDAEFTIIQIKDGFNNAHIDSINKEISIKFPKLKDKIFVLCAKEVQIIQMTKSESKVVESL